MKLKSILLIIVLSILAGCSSNPSIYMGAERNGFAISVNEAIEKAKPFFYQSYKLRNPSSELSEDEYSKTEYHQVFVYIEKQHYLVFRDLPKKMRSQHMASPVRVNIFTGEIVEPR